MPDIVVPLDDALDRILGTIRQRIVDARKNGQRVRMYARETGRQTMPMSAFQQKSLEEILATTRPDGGFELTIAIEPKR